MKRKRHSRAQARRERAASRPEADEVVAPSMASAPEPESSAPVVDAAPDSEPTVDPLAQGVLDQFGIDANELFGFVIIVDHVAVNDDDEPERRLSIRYSTVVPPWTVRGMLRHADGLVPR